MKKILLITSLMCLGFHFTGCSSGNGQITDVSTDPDHEGEQGECTTDEECDDGIDCTVDSCSFGGSCSHTPIDSECDPGQRCDETSGCVDIGCTSDAECNDDIDCTVDVCGVDGTCTNAPNDDLCEPGQTCSPTNGCIEPCEEDSDCDNGIFCDGDEKCVPEFGCMAADEPRDCDDNDPCTEDYCDTEEDRCVNNCVPSPECECPFDPNEAFNACYSITPTISQRCAFGQVNYTISQVCFTLEGPVLVGTVGPVFHDSSQQFSQVPAPSTPDFDVSYMISGGCEEHYGMSGTFSDVEHFEGTWTAEYIDYDGFSCALGGCPNQGIMISGTRMP